MKGKSKAFKILSTVALCSMIFGSMGNTTLANSNEAEGVATSAHYIKDGERIDIPKEDLDKLLDPNTIYALPGDTTNSDVEKNEINITPYANVCEPGYAYSARLTSGKFENHDSGTRQANKTSKELPFTSTVTGSFDISPSINVSGGFDWNVIEAEVGFDISATWSWSSSESTLIYIPVNRMGWNDFGSYRESWTGTYSYLTSSCGQSNLKTITVKGSKYKMNVARESAIPPGV